MECTKFCPESIRKRSEISLDIAIDTAFDYMATTYISSDPNASNRYEIVHDSCHTYFNTHNHWSSQKV